jgi:hypothetical protein
MPIVLAVLLLACGTMACSAKAGAPAGLAGGVDAPGGNGGLDDGGSVEGGSPFAPAEDGGPAAFTADSESPTPNAEAGLRVTCGKQQPGAQYATPMMPRSVEGTNGTFMNHCDNTGNLVAYSCEAMTTCVAPSGQADPLPQCTTTETGKVVAQPFDCSGHCMAGGCYARCPALNDLFSYVSIDAATGDATLQDQTDHRRYICKLIFNGAKDGYDCKIGPMPGSVAIMVGQGLKSTLCTGGAIGTIGLDAPDAGPAAGSGRCGYDCVVP